MGKKAEEIQAVIDNLRRIFQATNECSKSTESRTGLTGPQLWAIHILAREAPLRVSELARGMFLHPATAVGILDRLEGKGLVTRIRSKEDRRAVDLYLTDRGRELAETATENTRVILLNGLAELPDEQFACVEEGVQQVVRILGAGRIVPHPVPCPTREW